MLGKLAQDGYALTPDADGADVVVVNTCGFIEPARQESLGVIREMLALKEQGRVGAVVVAGCLAERQEATSCSRGARASIRSSASSAARRSPQVVDRAVQKRQRDEQRVAVPPRPGAGPGRHRPPAHHAAALRLSEDLRGLRPPLHLLRHPRRCAASTSPSRSRRSSARPGAGRRRRPRADPRRPGHDLLRPRPVRRGAARRAAARAGPGRGHRVDSPPLRLPGSLHRRADRRRSPAAKKIIPYLDMPLQHINDRVLQRMQSAASTATTTEELLGRLREAIPDLALRTTFIVGFPGETDAEFEELCGVRRARRSSSGRRLPLLARAGHAGRRARRPPARGGEGRPASRPAHGDAAGDRVRLRRRRRSARSWR